MSKIGKLRQRLGAFDFTEPLNKNNELGRRLRKKRILETQPHIGGGEPYKRRGRVIKRRPPSVDVYDTFPQEPTKPGTMEEDRYERQLTKEFPRPKIREKDRKPGTLFDNEGGLQDREFAADSLDDPSILDPDKWSGEDLKELEEAVTPPSLTNYTHKQPLRDKIHQKSPGAVAISDPFMSFHTKKIGEEGKYIADPQYKIKPIKPTRMEWRAIISAKQLKQRIAQVRLAVDYSSVQRTYGPDMDAIHAFKNKREYTSGKGVRNRKTGIRKSAFKWRTDGRTLFLHDNPVARHVKGGIEVSHAGHDTNLTFGTINALGIKARGSEHSRDNKVTLGTKKIKPSSKEWVLIPQKQIQTKPIEYKSQRPRSKAGLRPDQTAFRKRVFDPLMQEQGRTQGLPLSPTNIQPDDQRAINKITGLDTPIGDEILATEAHHILPDYKTKKKLGISADVGSGIPLPKDYHKFLTLAGPRSKPEANLRRLRNLQSKLRLKIARIRQRNISRGVPRIAMGQKALDVMNVFNKNPLRHRDRKGVGFTFDHLNNRFLDASKRREALEIRKTFGAEEGKNFGLNSITWTGEGPQKDLKIIERDLHSIEDDLKKDPILGGYEDSFEATFGVSGSSEEIISQLNKNQRESLIIDPTGYAFLRDHAGKETRLTELSPKYSDTAIKDSGGGKPNPLR